MDVLSDVLRVVRLDGALFFNGEFSAPWCFKSSESAAISACLSLHAGHLIIFHFLTEGRAYAKLEDGTRVELTAGDIVVFPHGNAHFLGNGPPIKPVDSFKTFGPNLMEGVKVARYGGGGELTRFVCGFLACEPHMSQVFLAGLPSILKVHVVNEPSGQWLENSIRYSVSQMSESSGSNDGTRVVLAKLSEVLFVETLRRYISNLPPDQIGWLAGARDPFIGQALALLHKEPAHPWTVEDLARRVGLSRTRFAERFNHFLGEPPMSYLARWRVKLGAELLQSTEQSVAEVAATVGYGSEAAFNRAFKRELDCPPAQFRRRRNTPPPALLKKRKGA
jgi:AraC-like DNA-binding protein